MSQRTNEQWITDLQTAGPEMSDALEDLRVILLNGLRRGLVGRVNTNGPEFEPLAEDFVQEALLKILANIDSFKGGSKFTTWAHKIAVRVALTELRRKRWQDRSLEDMLSAETPFSKPFSDHNPTPDALTEQNDMAAKLMRIIKEELSDKQRQAMLLVPMGGVPISVAAERMGMKRNAMYKLIHDARLRIKDKLIKEGLSAEDVLASFKS